MDLLFRCPPRRTGLPALPSSTRLLRAVIHSLRWPAPQHPRKFLTNPPAASAAPSSRLVARRFIVRPGVSLKNLKLFSPRLHKLPYRPLRHNCFLASQQTKSRNRLPDSLFRYSARHDFVPHDHNQQPRRRRSKCVGRSWKSLHNLIPGHRQLIKPTDLCRHADRRLKRRQFIRTLLFAPTSPPFYDPMSLVPRYHPIDVRHFELAAPLHGHRHSHNKIARLFRLVVHSLRSCRSHDRRDVDRLLEFVIIHLVGIQSAQLSVFRFPNSTVISRDKLDGMRAHGPVGDSLRGFFVQRARLHRLPQWNAPHKLNLLRTSRPQRGTSLPKPISPRHQKTRCFFYLYVPTRPRNPKRSVDSIHKILIVLRRPSAQPQPKQ